MAPLLDYARGWGDVMSGKLAALRILVARPSKGDTVTVFAHRDDVGPTEQAWFDQYDEEDEEGDWGWMTDLIFERLDVEAVMALSRDEDTRWANPLTMRDDVWTPISNSVAPKWAYRPLERQNEAKISDLDPSLPAVPCYTLDALDPSTPFVRNQQTEVQLRSSPGRLLFCKPVYDDPTEWILATLRLWQPLDHPNILRLAGLLHDHEGRILAMLCDFSSRGCPHEDENPNEPLATRLDWIVQIVEALDYIASLGLSYTDLKPHNVLVFEDEDDPRRSPHVKLADFDGNRTEGYFSADSDSFGLAMMVEEVVIPGSEGPVLNALQALVAEAKGKTVPRRRIVDQIRSIKEMAAPRSAQ